MARFATFFVYVWPEPRSSAAGVRTIELMHSLQRAGWQVAAVSPSGDGPYRNELEARGIMTLSCDPNQSARTESQLRKLSPDLCIFDRFVMEEQFGWRSRELWPRALQIVDTQDLHSLRRARERLSSQNANWDRLREPSISDLGDDLLRECAALYRADGALVVSSFEAELLAKFNYPKERLLHLPFPTDTDSDPVIFQQRSGFCFLGNFRHPPNLDSVRWLLSEIWPALRAQLPQAELHLYGAYPPAEISRHKGDQGVFAQGPVVDHRAALRSHRILLAPLRFGAGIKGKVLEAWGCGTPVIGSPLTFEGMGAQGGVARTCEEFVELAVKLHENENSWICEQERGLSCVKNQYARDSLARAFLHFVEERLPSIESRRSEDLIGRMLRHQQQNAMKYFSRWIEAKNELAHLPVEDERKR